MKAIFRREQFDIVHIHEPLIPAVSLAALQFSDSVKVGTFHACHNTPRGYYYWHWLLKRYFKRLDGRIAVSQPARDFVARHFPGDYRIIPNGIDLEHFAADVPPIEEFCDGKVNILFLGRLEKRKGFNYLLKAYGRIKRAFPDSRLVVVGPGTRLRRKYMKEVSKMRLEDVVFAGYASYSELPRYYRTADIFCAPATGEESFGIVLLEAMAAGKPIIASNICGYASVVNDGVEGLLVPTRDEEALACAISSLLNDQALRRQMGARGRATVEKYRWDHVAQMVVGYYLELLDGSHREIKDV
jgi:phosphatidylinositol alpha-mannosyltransferase